MTKLSDDDRAALQLAAAEVFSGPAGERVLEYLRDQTQKVALTPPFDISQSAFLEGQRYLFGTIESLILSGRILKLGVNNASQAVPTDERPGVASRIRGRGRKR